MSVEFTLPFLLPDSRLETAVLANGVCRHEVLCDSTRARSTDDTQAPLATTRHPSAVCRSSGQELPHVLLADIVAVQLRASV